VPSEANRVDSNHFHKRARRYYLFANDYFKDPVLGALPVVIQRVFTALIEAAKVA
jgi:hypothetical protein